MASTKALPAQGLSAHGARAAGKAIQPGLAYRRVLVAGALAALAASGCATTTGDRAQLAPARFLTALNPGSAYVRAGDLPGERPALVRLQSPAQEPAPPENQPVVSLPPPLPDATLPSTISAADQPDTPPSEIAPPANVWADLPAEIPAASRATIGRVPAALEGLSSISRNRALGRIAAEETNEPTFPDLYSNPASNWRERFGVEPQPGDDPFLFPWLMNLIFEDRWLLFESDPKKALQSQLRRRMRINIRDPDPDTANFPNGAYTLPKGRMYIENSPLGLYGASKTVPRTYQWEFLYRYGLTDNLEFRIFSNGLTARAAQGTHPGTTGFSPLAFDFKANFWEENPEHHIPAMGAEIYLQTTFGSPAFNGGTQPSINLLFDQTLPLEINFEYNLGITGVQNSAGQIVYEFSFQWSFQRQVVQDFDVFIQGFYNASALPRTLQFQSASTRSALAPANMVGAGAIWTVNDRLAIFGSYNFGTTTGSPRTLALMGFAVGF